MFPFSQTIVCFGKWTTTSHPNPLSRDIENETLRNVQEFIQRKKNWKNMKARSLYTRQSTTERYTSQSTRTRMANETRKKEEKDWNYFHIFMKGEVVLRQGWWSIVDDRCSLLRLRLTKLRVIYIRYQFFTSHNPLRSSSANTCARGSRGSSLSSFFVVITTLQSTEFHPKLTFIQSLEKLLTNNKVHLLSKRGK